MAKRSIADLDFDFRDDGELELTGFEEGDIFEEEEDFLEEDEVEEIEEEIEEEEDKSIAGRVSNLEKTLQALPAMISNSIATALSASGIGKAKEKEEEEEEELPDELDNKQIVNILAKRMEKAVKSEVGNAVKSMAENDPAMKEARLTADFRQLAHEFGQPFVDRMLLVGQAIQDSGRKISAREAWNIVKRYPAPPSKTGKSGQKPIQRKAVKVDADSDDSVGSFDEPTPRPKFNAKKMKETSDADMFQQSWNGALLTTAKRGRRA